MQTRPRSLPLLLRFGLSSTLLVALLGVALSVVLAGLLEARAHNGAEEKGRVIALAGIEPHLSHDDLQGMGPAQLDRVDALLKSQHLRAFAIRRVKIFSEQARLVYSDSRRQIGASARDSAMVRSALAGDSRSSIVVGTDHNGRGERML